MSSDDFLKISYDSEKRIWKSINYPYENLTKRSLGEAFLQSMRSLEPEKILEYHYDEQKEKRVRDLYQESIRVAENLKYLGMQTGDVVLLFSGYNYLTSSLTFGTILMGGVVNFFEVKLDAEGIVSIFEIIQPFMIVYEEQFLPKLFESLKRYKPKSLKYMFAIKDTKSAPCVTNELLKSRGAFNYDEFQAIYIHQPEKETAFLVLTSGSTGLPKVTQLTHCLLLNSVYVWWANPFNYEPPNKNSVLFSLNPLRWISQVALLLQSAILGIKRICANEAATGRYGLQILRNTKPTHLFCAPAFLYEILLRLEEGDTHSLDSLKYIQLGGEPPSIVITNLSKKFVLNSRLFYSYGMSEAAGSITNDSTISGGKLQNGFEMQVLDDNLQPLAHNQKGQLAIKTPYPLIGYKNKDTSQHFLENGFFLSGDFGYFDEENTLHVLGRLEDLITNENISLIPNLVEPIMLNLTEVVAARLVGYPITKDNRNQVAALFVILQKGAFLSHEQISTKIYSAFSTTLSKEQLSLIRDVYVEESFPLTTCGKIDRLVLKNLALERAKLN